MLRSGIYVRIKNDGDGFLSECIVSIVDIKPAPENDGHTVLSSIGSLLKGEHRYILLASINEQPTHPHGVFNDRLGFAFAMGGLFAGWVTIPLPVEADPALITVEAKALECRTERRQFKLWVDDSRRLFMAPV